MAGFDYAAAKQKADAIIRKFARKDADGITVVPGTLIRPTSTGGSQFVPGTHGKAETPIIMVVVDYEQRERDQSIQVRDRRVMISPLAPDGSDLAEKPTTSHRIVLPGESVSDGSYEIVSVKPLDPGSIDVFYDCQGRF